MGERPAAGDGFFPGLPHLSTQSYNNSLKGGWKRPKGWGRDWYFSIEGRQKDLFFCFLSEKQRQVVDFFVIRLSLQKPGCASA